MHKVSLNEIREHYRTNMTEIMADELGWGIDAYAWDELGIRLTPIEQALWFDIRSQSCVLYPQFPVGPYFIDFANPVHKVGIECDGSAYHLDRAKDEFRQRKIEAMGWTIYRITGKDCKTADEEIEDDHGVRVKKSAAQLFIKRICVKHPIRVGGSAWGRVGGLDQ